MSWEVETMVKDDEQSAVDAAVKEERARTIRLLTWRRECHRMWANAPGCKSVAAYVDTIRQFENAIADVESGMQVPAKADDAAAYNRTPAPPVGQPVQFAARDRYDTDQAFADQVNTLFADAMRRVFGETNRENLAEKLSSAFREAFAHRPQPKPAVAEPVQRSLLGGE